MLLCVHETMLCIPFKFLIYIIIYNCAFLQVYMTIDLMCTSYDCFHTFYVFFIDIHVLISSVRFSEFIDIIHRILLNPLLILLVRLIARVLNCTLTGKNLFSLINANRINDSFSVKLFRKIHLYV